MKLTYLLRYLILLILSLSVLACNEDSTTQYNPSSEQRAKTKWLFAFNAQRGQFEYHSHLQQIPFLILENCSQNVIMFSDRPKRKAETVPFEDFLSLWNKDKTFRNIPPNALFHFFASNDADGSESFNIVATIDMAELDLNDSNKLILHLDIISLEDTDSLAIWDNNMNQTSPPNDIIGVSVSIDSASYSEDFTSFQNQIDPDSSTASGQSSNAGVQYVQLISASNLQDKDDLILGEKYHDLNKQLPSLIDKVNSAESGFVNYSINLANCQLEEKIYYLKLAVNNTIKNMRTIASVYNSRLHIPLESIDGSMYQISSSYADSRGSCPEYLTCMGMTYATHAICMCVLQPSPVNSLSQRFNTCLDTANDNGDNGDGSMFPDAESDVLDGIDIVKIIVEVVFAFL